MNWSTGTVPNENTQSVVFDGSNNNVTSVRAEGMGTVGQFKILSPATANKFWNGTGASGANGITISPVAFFGGVGIDMSNATTDFTFAPWNSSKWLALVVPASQTWNINGSSANGNLILANTGTTGVYYSQVQLGTNALTLNVGSGRTVDMTGSVFTGTSASRVIKNGAGTLRLATGAASTMTGPWAGNLTINSGTALLAVNGGLSGSSSITVSGGALDMSTFSGTVGGGGLTLSSGSVLGSGTLTSSTAYSLQQGSVQAPLAGGVGLTKTTSGTVTLSGVNAYTGATTVSAGTLSISSIGSINSSSGITVNGSGAELKYNSATALTAPLTLTQGTLSGTGAINSALALTSTSAILSPGNSPGILSFGTSQTWNSFAYLWETDFFTGTTPGTDFDQIAITGGLDLSGGTSNSFLLDLRSLTAADTPGDVGGFIDESKSWSIITATGGITGFDANDWWIETGFFGSNPPWSGSWSVSQLDNSIMLNYSSAVVPEPGSLALAGIGALTAGWAARRRCRRSSKPTQRRRTQSRPALCETYFGSEPPAADGPRWQAITRLVEGQSQVFNQSTGLPR